MKVIVAIDKFKGCASSQQLSDAIEEALKQIKHDATVVKVPVADGGDGTMRVIRGIKGDSCQNMQVSVPACIGGLPPVDAQYFIDTTTMTAFMDLATATGLALVPPPVRNVMQASTFGTGVMMMHAIGHGARSIVLGLGGSATCDGAMGILAALGCQFLDRAGNTLEPCAQALSRIHSISTVGLAQNVKQTHITALVDVDNPLLGNRGAAATFAPQKGASPSQVKLLEQALTHWSKFMPPTVASQPGAGAAGGAAAGLAAMLHAKLTSGIDYILGLNHFDEIIGDAQLIITGEGRIDKQTMHGKAPAGVLRAAKRCNIPVVALCGSVDPELNLKSYGFEQVIEVTPHGMPLQEALNTTTALCNVKNAIAKLPSHLFH